MLPWNSRKSIDASIYILRSEYNECRSIFFNLEKDLDRQLLNKEEVGEDKRNVNAKTRLLEGINDTDTQGRKIYELSSVAEETRVLLRDSAMVLG